MPWMTLASRAWILGLGTLTNRVTCEQVHRVAGKGLRTQRYTMAIYHLKASAITRSKGQSAVASAAYRAGEKLHDTREGKTHDSYVRT